MKRPMLMAFLAGLITTPVLFVLLNIPIADGAGQGMDSLSPVSKRTFSINLKKNQAPVIRNVKGQQKTTKVSPDRPAQLGALLIEVYEDVDLPPGHEHDYDDQIFSPSGMSDKATNLHNGYSHCWIQIGGVWTQIHC